jgi:hypothetical protein
MKDIDIAIYNNYQVSIKDLSHDLDISEFKWNDLISVLEKTFERIYFYGYRDNYVDEHFRQTVSYLSEEIFIDESKHQLKLMFKLYDYSVNLKIKTLRDFGSISNSQV